MVNDLHCLALIVVHFSRYSNVHRQGGIFKVTVIKPFTRCWRNVVGWPPAVTSCVASARAGAGGVTERDGCLAQSVRSWTEQLQDSSEVVWTEALVDWNPHNLKIRRQLARNVVGESGWPLSQMFIFIALLYCCTLPSCRPAMLLVHDSVAWLIEIQV